MLIGHRVRPLWAFAARSPFTPLADSCRWWSPAVHSAARLKAPVVFWIFSFLVRRLCVVVLFI